MKRLFFIHIIILLFFFLNIIFSEENQTQEIPRISAFLAYQKFKSGNIIIIDAMNKKRYEKYHVIGAINIPGDTNEDLKKIDEMPLQILPSKEIIVYCD